MLSGDSPAERRWIQLSYVDRAVRAGYTHRACPISLLPCDTLPLIGNEIGTRIQLDIRPGAYVPRSQLGPFPFFPFLCYALPSGDLPYAHGSRNDPTSQPNVVGWEHQFPRNAHRDPYPHFRRRPHDERGRIGWSLYTLQKLLRGVGGVQGR